MDGLGSPLSTYQLLQQVACPQLCCSLGGQSNGPHEVVGMCGAALRVEACLAVQPPMCQAVYSRGC